MDIPKIKSENQYKMLNNQTNPITSEQKDVENKIKDEYQTKEETKNNVTENRKDKFIEELAKINDFIFYNIFKPLIAFTKGAKVLYQGGLIDRKIGSISGLNHMVNIYIMGREINKALEDGKITKKEAIELAGKGIGLYTGDIIGGLLGLAVGATIGGPIGGVIGKAIGTTLGSMYGKDIFKKLSTKAYEKIKNHQL